MVCFEVWTSYFSAFGADSEGVTAELNFCWRDITVPIKVTVDFLRKKIPSAKKLSKRTIYRRLEDAGLAWLRRRRKTLVTAVHKKAREAFSEWVLSRTMTTLKRWVYSDGTAFYLAKSITQKSSTLRGALGPRVWRMASGSDALYDDCVGPSAYWKAQGGE